MNPSPFFAARGELAMWIRAVLSLMLVGVSAPGAGQNFEIESIDSFGLGEIPPEVVARELGFAEGDVDSRENFRARGDEAEKRIEQLPGVADAEISFGCCDEMKAYAYLGIRRTGVEALVLRDAPRGNVRLSEEILATGKELEAALAVALRNGQREEEIAEGHALAKNAPAVRAIQERLLVFAREPARLQEMLRDSSDPHHRAFAVAIIAYAKDKDAVVGDLVYAMSDPDPGVRNNAARALAVMATAAAATSKPLPSVPVETLIKMLNSAHWSDRNKAIGILYAMTYQRDPALLRKLHTDALESLTEFARFKREADANGALRILGRIAGLTERQIEEGTREAIIEQARAVQFD
jgi:hypothetical protein